VFSNKVLKKEEKTRTSTPKFAIQVITISYIGRLSYYFGNGMGQKVGHIVEKDSKNGSK